MRVQYGVTKGNLLLAQALNTCHVYKCTHVDTLPYLTAKSIADAPKKIRILR